MPTITLDKVEYKELRKKAANYDRILAAVQEDFFAPPLVTDRKNILVAFRKTKLYNREFLDSLHRGLKRSNYFTG